MDYVPAYSGSYGDGLEWSLSDDCSVLTVSGTGTAITMYAQDAGWFAASKKITRIVLPGSVESIGLIAFERCPALREITIPASVTSIGASAFNLCSNLTDVYYGGTEAQWNAVQIAAGNDSLLAAQVHFGGSEDTDYHSLPVLTVPESVAVIEPQAFAGTAAQVIIIPASCTSVAEDAFDGCPNLKYIVNRSHTVILPPDGVTLITESN